MAVTKITYDDKVSLVTSTLPEENKVTDNNMNEIKDVINNNANQLLNLDNITVLFKNLNNTSNDITLSDSVDNYDYIDIFYKVNRGDGYAIEGDTKVLQAKNKYFDANAVFYLDSSVVGSASLFKINTDTITLQSSCNYQFSNGIAPGVNTNNSIKIIQVLGCKKFES